MADDTPFPGGNDPFAGIPDALKPNPPAPIPEAPSAGDPMVSASPFKEPLDIEQAIKNLTFDRPLKLFIPNKERFPDWEFRIINSIPGEIADAHNKGFREVTDPQVSQLFNDLVAGTDKTGKAFRPILCARPKEVGKHIRKRYRVQLQSLYAGMDPGNKEFNSKYAAKVDPKDGTFLQREGTPWKIRI